MGGGASASKRPEKSRSAASGSALHWVRWRRRQMLTNEESRRQAWDLEVASDSDAEMEVVFDDSASSVVRGAILHAFRVCEEDYCNLGLEFGEGEGHGKAIHITSGEDDFEIEGLDLARFAGGKADANVAAAEAELLEALEARSRQEDRNHLLR
mmetsp:Transcript_40098/g.63650  ORF Transcript_40098/g.63650 Transcript_40098/m.63650 type:complete len:154 (+) Transcript_40098:89-550(+)